MSMIGTTIHRAAMNEQSAGEDGPTIERAGRALIEAVPAPAKVPPL